METKKSGGNNCAQFRKASISPLGRYGTEVTRHVSEAREISVQDAAPRLHVSPRHRERERETMDSTGASHVYFCFCVTGIAQNWLVFYFGLQRGILWKCASSLCRSRLCVTKRGFIVTIYIYSFFHWDRSAIRLNMELIHVIYFGKIFRGGYNNYIPWKFEIS